MGQTITSPAESSETSQTLFLAGGISNCPDWQSPVAELLEERTTLTVFNPRRNGWNMENSDEESTKQIIWEHKHLDQSETILFWFPMETLCPITLFEYGKFLVSGKALIVGAHPEYQRRLDLEVQTKLERPNLKVWDNLDDMIHAYVSRIEQG